MTAKELVNEALAEVRKANALKAGKIKQVEKGLFGHKCGSLQAA